MSSPFTPCESALIALPESLLVGVSGGVDSVALLHALVRSGRKPVVLHFDHGWRPESSADARRVRMLAEQLGLRHAAGKMPATTKPHREADARVARYVFFARTAQRLG